MVGKVTVNGTAFVDGLTGGGAWLQSPPPDGAPGMLGNGCEVPVITTPTGLTTPSSVRSTAGLESTAVTPVTGWGPAFTTENLTCTDSPAWASPSPLGSVRIAAVGDRKTGGIALVKSGSSSR